MSCGDASVTRVAVLDPLRTHGPPVAAAAATEVDALVHGDAVLGALARCR